MGSYSYNSKNSSYGYNNQNPSFGPEFQRLFDPFSNNLGGFNGVLRGGPALSHSLVLDSEKGELVKAPARVGKKGVSEAKALAALKSHSEAERRRRERINAHLTTLRSLVPCTDKVNLIFICCFHVINNRTKVYILIVLLIISDRSSTS